MPDTVTETYKTPAGEVEVTLPEGNPLLDRHAYPAYEPVVTDRFKDNIEPGDIFYDVGCRFGIYSLLALELGVEGGNIHSFDKDEEAIEVFKESARGRIENIHNVPVVNTVSVVNTSKDLSLDMYSIVEDAPPDVIKMDIEGAEIKALRGAGEILLLNSPKLFIEIHPWRLRDNFDSSPNEVVKLLRESGYDHIEVAPQQRTEGTDWVDIENYQFNMSHNDNALFAEDTDG